MSPVEGRLIAIDASVVDFDSVLSVVGALPCDFATPILIQVREADVSTSGLGRLRERLRAVGRRKVFLATSGQTLVPGGVWLCGHALGTVFDANCRCWRGSSSTLEWNVSELFRIVATAYGAEAIGLVLFRYDESERACVLAIRDAGGTTIAQCSDRMRRGKFVWDDAPDYILPTNDITLLLLRLVARMIPAKLKRPSPNPVVVIGASAGGVQAFQRVAGQLADEFTPPIFMLLHRRRGTRSHPNALQRIIAAATNRPVRIAQDGEEIRSGVIYLPQQDKHMLIRNDTIRLADEPDKGEWRPSIDALFISAAECYGPRAIGVLLTGMLDDGVLGLNRITEYGGITIAQTPEDAVAPAMPINAIRHDHPNYVLPLDQLGELLQEISGHPFPRGVNSDSVALRAAMTAAHRQHKKDETK